MPHFKSSCKLLLLIYVYACDRVSDRGSGIVAVVVIAVCILAEGDNNIAKLLDSG